MVGGGGRDKEMRLGFCCKSLLNEACCICSWQPKKLGRPPSSSSSVPPRRFVPDVQLATNPPRDPADVGQRKRQVGGPLVPTASKKMPLSLFVHPAPTPHRLFFQSTGPGHTGGSVTEKTVSKTGRTYKE